MEHRVQVLCPARRDSLARGDLFQSQTRLAELGAMLVAPGGIEALAILFEAVRDAALARDRAETLLTVNFLDPRDRGHLESGLSRIVVERQRPRAHDGVRRDDLG